MHDKRLYIYPSLKNKYLNTNYRVRNDSGCRPWRLTHSLWYRFYFDKVQIDFRWTSLLTHLILRWQTHSTRWASVMSLGGVGSVIEERTEIGEWGSCVERGGMDGMWPYEYIYMYIDLYHRQYRSHHLVDPENTAVISRHDRLTTEKPPHKKSSTKKTTLRTGTRWHTSSFYFETSKALQPNHHSKANTTSP
jgi:hypothetical protein